MFPIPFLSFLAVKCPVLQFSCRPAPWLAIWLSVNSLTLPFVCSILKTNSNTCSWVVPFLYSHFHSLTSLPDFNLHSFGHTTTTITTHNHHNHRTSTPTRPSVASINVRHHHHSLLHPLPVPYSLTAITLNRFRRDLLDAAMQRDFI